MQGLMGGASGPLPPARAKSRYITASIPTDKEKSNWSLQTPESLVFQTSSKITVVNGALGRDQFRKVRGTAKTTW
jgi:hypothetical protein